MFLLLFTPKHLCAYQKSDYAKVFQTSFLRPNFFWSHATKLLSTGFAFPASKSFVELPQLPSWKIWETRKRISGRVICTNKPEFWIKCGRRQKTPFPIFPRRGNIDTFECIATLWDHQIVKKGKRVSLAPLQVLWKYLLEYQNSKDFKFSSVDFSCQAKKL